MTTEAAEAAYLAGHTLSMAGRGWVTYNPHNKPAHELQVIYGFNNGGAPGWWRALALAEDGTPLGAHVCSSEGYMPHDLGILEGTRPDRHAEQYQPHYPDGYRMEWVPSAKKESNEGWKKAVAACNAKYAEEQHGAKEEGGTK